MSCLPSPELGKQKGKKTQNQTASIAQAFASLVLALPLELAVGAGTWTELSPRHLCFSKCWGFVKGRTSLGSWAHQRESRVMPGAQQCKCK